MASYYTSDEIIKSAKRRASVPSAQVTFKNEDFLAFANEEMALGLVPSVLEMKEDYLLRTDAVSLVSDQLRYPIPERAIGNKLRELSFRDTNGNICEMTRVSIGDKPFYNGSFNQASLYAYYVENDEIVLLPDSSNPNIASGSLMMSYYIRPNELVLLADVGVITNINTTTGEITVSSLPTDFGAANTYDFITMKSPFKSLAISLTPTAVNSTTKILTFAPADLPSRLAVGDHVALAGQSAVPQIPSDLHVVLAHRVATRCLEAIGDMEGLQAANAKLAEFEKKTTKVIDNRVEDSPKKIVPRHASIRNGLSNRRYRFGR